MLDLDFEKKINFIIFKIHSSRRKMLAEPELPKFKLDENGEPVEVESSATLPASKQRIDPQTILISATLNSGIKEIARRLNVSEPVVIDASYSEDRSSTRGSTSSSLTAMATDDDNNEAVEKIAMPSRLSHFYMSVPSKLRLVGLIAFILDKFIVSAFLNAQLVRHT